MDYIEKSPIETGFAEVFYDRIEPELNMLEGQRQHMHDTGRRKFWLIMGIGIAFAIGAYVLLRDHDYQLFAVIGSLAIGLFVAGLAKSKATRGYSGTVNNLIMPVVCDFLGDTQYDRHAQKGFSLGRFKELKLVGSYDDDYLEDRIEGTQDGVRYAMVEARLTETSTDSDGDSNTSTVFKGLLFRIDLPSPSPTRILITRDYGKVGNTFAGMFSGNKGRGMPRVETNHPEFERHFELHADDAQAALDYLPGAFLDNLMEIAATADGGPKGMRAAFDGRDFLLALDRSRPFLRMPGVHEPLDGISTEINKVFEDFSLVKRIITLLKT
ncbi:DUF3137 domain-containing protein [uncultured Pelagimonas sp.]|uniref:DUF3137 domain-containing protein n=1 Tax=uncultured Pelagimonas sp. TaxID=1618102 RepID=UPI0026044B1B|nr:DUF3137 domain-containing protein [uncultured Pelagimonas sp.]